MELTGRQREVYEFIVHFRRENGCSPSIPELQRAFGIRSPNGVAGHLQALEAKGYIRRAERGSRQVDVVGETRSATVDTAMLHAVPIYGHIPAGPPTEYQSLNPDGMAMMDETLLGIVDVSKNLDENENLIVNSTKDRETISQKTGYAGNIFPFQ